MKKIITKSIWTWHVEYESEHRKQHEYKTRNAEKLTLNIIDKITGFHPVRHKIIQ